MTCAEISNLTPLYLSGELDAQRRAALEAHLRTCRACSQEFAEQVSVDSLVREFATNERFDVSAIEQHVRAGMQTSSGGRQLAWLAAAAALVVALVGYEAVLGLHANNIYAAAASDHHREIVEARPRKWITSTTEMAQVAAKQGISSFDAQSLAPAGYHFERGRVCLLNGMFFVHLVYAGSGGNFSLFLRKLDTPRFASSKAGEYASEHVAGFRKNGITAVLAADESAASVRQLATAVEKAI
jgi:anti-sigma factor RsiW